MFPRNVTLFISFLLALFPFSYISSKLFLTKREVWLDEAIFHSVTTTFLETGRLTTDIYGSLAPYIQKTQFMYPPLFFWVQSIWFRIFSDSIESIRALSLVCAIGVLVVAYFIVKRLTLRRYLSLLVVVLLSLDCRFLLASRIGRVEMLTLLCMSLSLFWFIKAKQTDSRQSYVVSGMAAGLAGLGHFMGYMIVSILCISYLAGWRKHKKSLVPLVYIALPTFLFTGMWLTSYLTYIYSLIEQVAYQVSVKSQYIGILQAQIPSVFGIVHSLVFGSSVAILYGIQKFDKNVRVVLVGLVVSFVFAWFAKDEWYSLYFYYFLNVVFVVGFIIGLSHKKIYIMTLCAVFGIWGIFTSVLQIRQDMHNPYDYHQYAQGIAELIPADVKNICLFVTPDPYFELIKDPQKNVYEYIYGTSERVDRGAFLNHCDAMIFNRVPEGIQVIGSGVSDFLALHTSNVIYYDHTVYPVAIVVMKK